MGYELGETGTDRAGVGPGGKRGGDRAEAPVRISQGHVGHREEELVTTESDDQVVGAQALLDERHDALEQLIAGAVTLGVVEGLESDDIDVGDDEQAGGPAAAIQFVVKLGQARCSRACSREGVGFRDGKLVGESLAVCEGVPPLSGGPFAVSCCGMAVPGGQSAVLRGLCAVLRGAVASLGGGHDDLGVGAGGLVGGVVLCHRAIARVGGVVARQRREIAGVRDLVTLVGGVETRVSGLHALAGVAPADVTAVLVYARVDPVREVAIAGRLVAVGGQLVTVGACLVAVRACLVGVCQGLVGVGKRLLAAGDRLGVTGGRLFRARGTGEAVGRRVRRGGRWECVCKRIQ